MIRNVVLGILFFDLILAIILLLNGIHQIELGSSFYTFINQVSREMEQFSVQIPNIPEIQQNYAVYNDFINALIGIVNFLVKVLNFIILIINSIIKVLVFIFMLIKNITTLIYNLISSNGATAEPVVLVG